MNADELLCRICSCQKTPDDPLCSPCKCKGSMNYVQVSCINTHIQATNSPMCSVCKYKYVFKKIYKEDTPKHLPPYVIVCGICQIMFKLLKIALWSVYQGVCWLFIILLNGAMIRFCILEPRFWIVEFITWICLGIFVTPLVYIHYLLFIASKQLFRRVDRRRIRINTSGALNMLTSSTITRNHQELVGMQYNSSFMQEPSNDQGNASTFSVIQQPREDSNNSVEAHGTNEVDHDLIPEISSLQHNVHLSMNHLDGEPALSANSHSIDSMKQEPAVIDNNDGGALGSSDLYHKSTSRNTKDKGSSSSNNKIEEAVKSEDADSHLYDDSLNRMSEVGLSNETANVDNNQYRRPEIVGTGNTTDNSTNNEQDVFTPTNRATNRFNSQESAVGNPLSESSASSETMEFNNDQSNFSPNFEFYIYTQVNQRYSGFLNDLYKNLRYTGFSIFFTILYQFSKIFRFKLPNNDFTRFLAKVQLDNIVVNMICFAFSYLIMLLCLDHIRKYIRTNFIWDFYAFLKVFTIMKFGFVYNCFFSGIVNHYIFSTLLNDSKSVLELQRNINGIVMSLAFHFIIGFQCNVLYMNILTNIKRLFRPGIMHSLDLGTDSSLKTLSELSKLPASYTISRLIFNFCIYASISYIWMNLLKYYVGSLPMILIKSPIKLGIFMKAITTLSSCHVDAQKVVTNFVGVVFKFQAEMLKLSNFLYNTKVAVDDLSKLKWLPNRNSFYHRSQIYSKRSKTPSSEQVKKYFCESTREKFSIFYVPDYFVLRCGVLCLTAALVLQGFYTLCIYMAIKIMPEISFVENSQDIAFILSLSFVFALIALIKFVLRNSMFKIYVELVNLFKRVVVSIYLLFIWPSLATIIYILLYGNFMEIYSTSSLFMLFLNLSFILRIIINNLVFIRPVETFSFSMILKKLYMLTTFMSTLLVMVLVFKLVNFVAGIDIVLLAMVILILFLNNYERRDQLSFLESLRDQNYLISREIVDYVEG